MIVTPVSCSSKSTVICVSLLNSLCWSSLYWFNSVDHRQNNDFTLKEFGVFTLKRASHLMKKRESGGMQSTDWLVWSWRKPLRHWSPKINTVLALKSLVWILKDDLMINDFFFFFVLDALVYQTDHHLISSIVRAPYMSFKLYNSYWKLVFVLLFLYNNQKLKILIINDRFLLSLI